MTSSELNLMKEFGLDYDVKMDAVNLQGVWLNFPKGKVGHGRGYYAAAKWVLSVIHELGPGNLSVLDTFDKRRAALVRKMEERIEQEDQDDLVTILSL